MRIMGIGNTEAIPACVVFDYKGYKVSASTVFKPNSVYVMDREARNFISPDVWSIERAIEWIENHIKETEDGV